MYVAFNQDIEFCTFKKCNYNKIHEKLLCSLVKFYPTRLNYSVTKFFETKHNKVR